jgi:hypothetical protein
MQTRLFVPALFVAALWFTRAARATTPFLVDFDTSPPLPPGPSIYSGEATQTINIPGKVTFSGGFVSGNPTNFPQASHASLPNLYFTTHSIDNALSPTIRIDIDPAFHVNGVSGTLFDGGTPTGRYTLTAFSGTNVVATQNLTVGDFGFSPFSLTNDPITSVTIFDTTGTTSWDFLIDDVSFSVVPEPSTFALAALGAASLYLVGVVGALERNKKPRDCDANGAVTE